MPIAYRPRFMNGNSSLLQRFSGVLKKNEITYLNYAPQIDEHSLRYKKWQPQQINLVFLSLSDRRNVEIEIHAQWKQ